MHLDYEIVEKASNIVYKGHEYLRNWEIHQIIHKQSYVSNKTYNRYIKILARSEVNKKKIEDTPNGKVLLSDKDSRKVREDNINIVKTE